jgi:Polyketide cyclase / dehydrase and lipid transport
VRTAWARGTVPLQPAEALALWADVERWPSFVEGFARVIECSPGWPAEGERVSWESSPGGRGRVTEKVVERGPDRFTTMVFESALMGRQTLRAVPHSVGAEVELSLEYTLVKYGPLSIVADVLFIRRALGDALARTVSRFAVEAEEDAGLR